MAEIVAYNNLLYSDPTTRRKLVVCCANFTTSLLCSVGPVSKALSGLRNMSQVSKALKTVVWLLPYSLLTVGYLSLFFVSGLKILPVLAILAVVLMLILVLLHGYADMTLDLACHYDEGVRALLACYGSCYLFAIYVSLPVVILVSGFLWLLT
jgi:hypothetical protein